MTGKRTTRVMGSSQEAGGVSRKGRRDSVSTGGCGAHDVVTTQHAIREIWAQLLREVVRAEKVVVDVVAGVRDAHGADLLTELLIGERVVDLVSPRQVCRPQHPHTIETVNRALFVHARLAILCRPPPFAYPGLGA